MVGYLRERRFDDTRRKIDAALKAKIASGGGERCGFGAALRGSYPIRLEEVAPGAGGATFETGTGGGADAGREREIESCTAKIGQLIVERDFL